MLRILVKEVIAGIRTTKKVAGYNLHRLPRPLALPEHSIKCVPVKASDHVKKNVGRQQSWAT